MSTISALKNLTDKIERSTDIPAKEKQQLMINIHKLAAQKMNIMITGATGCGKSSTINALFGTEKAKVGTGPTPETMDIQKYELDNLIIWDTPGLGDGKDADARHKRNIINLLHEQDKENPGRLLIDLVLVILDGSTRDLGTSYDLINDVIIPNLGLDKDKRIIVAINQADAAMKGKFWDEEKHLPEPQLVEFLDKKAASVKTRIKEATGVDVDPIYYSAGYKEEGIPQETPYNITKLLYYIIFKAPEEKQAIIFAKRNNTSWHTSTQSNEELNYQEATETQVKKSTLSSVMSGAAGGVAIGGKLAGPIGGIVGGIIGGIGGLISSACYITTATCISSGKSDNCSELTILRNFRDNWLLKQPHGTELVAEYYRTAPTLVEKINQRDDKQVIYKTIENDYLSPCIDFIGKKQFEKCKDKYIDMINWVKDVVYVN